MASIDFTDKNTLLKLMPGNRRKRKKGRRRAMLVLVIALAAGVPAVALFSAANAGSAAPADAGPPAPSQAKGLAGYVRQREALSVERERLAGEFKRAADERGRRRVLNEAGPLLWTAVETGLIPSWYGTAYGFNGISETPGSGSIACGFFVTTVLRDAGFRVERSELARQPSESIIRSLVEEGAVTRYSGLSGDEFLERLRSLEPGWYVLGLDKHVGFLALGPGGAFFIHSTLLAPYGVVREPATSSHALMSSSYRVLGQLSADKRLLVKWLGGEKIATRK